MRKNFNKARTAWIFEEIASDRSVVGCRADYAYYDLDAGFISRIIYPANSLKKAKFERYFQMLSTEYPC